MSRLFNVMLGGVIAVTIAACGTDDANKLNPDKVYFFYQQTCPHCHHALEYINRTAPDVPMEMVSIDGAGRDLFIECVEKFDLPRDAIGTPLICMGDNYLMGWATEYEAKFDQYIAPYRINGAPSDSNIE